MSKCCRAVVTGESVTCLKREPPRIEAEDFLRSMADWHSSWGWKDIFREWHSFDTGDSFPDAKSKLLEWVLKFRNMKNVPLSTDNVLEVLDVWLANNGKAGVHPEIFKEHVEKFTTFMRHCCYSPSLLVAYNEPFSHDDDLEWVFFFVGRLRSESQTFVVQSFLLNCWI
ncbi:unnamed protein product [Symbiodinium sp. CCMP2592]|nr:unnamed protein product [Symbiodinium sp. CCMP2592]